MAARVILISGPCGTGKTTLSRILADNSAHARTVHIHTDDFYQYIRKGYTAPWLTESGDQNETVIESVVASAERFSSGGYEVFVDGTIGPWFLYAWMAIARKGVDVRYIVLRPDEKTTTVRAMEREQREHFPLTSENIKDVWRSFSDLGEFEGNAVDTTGQTPTESAALIEDMLRKDGFRID